MTHPHADLISRFYTAFAARDSASMAACYHPEVHFRDEAFDLRGPRAAAMWHMLVARGTDLAVTFRDVRADDQAGSAHWDATYTFTKTGRTVHNQIDAAFTFRDGLMYTHRDTFDFWRWSRQALGVPGLLLGWTPMLRAKVGSEATRQLDNYIRKHPELAN